MSGALSHDYAVKQAAERSLVVHYPADDELFIDIDSEADLERYETARAILAQNGWFESEKRTPSPSGKPGRYHIRLRVYRKITTLERIALQAALGSDPKREILAILKLEYEEGKPCTMFFEHPEK